MSHDHDKQRIALISLAATVGVLLFKLVVGVRTRSLGILAEAAHSALDLLAAVLTWFSLRIAARPADANHPFGHGKFESFSAFLETGLLAVTALAIAVAAFRNLMLGVIAVRLDYWAFVVMATSMGVDWWRAGILQSAAARYASDALAADALNYSTDLATSAAVFAGLALVGLGERLGVPWLLHADALAAVVVAAAMLALALRLARRSAGVLLDEAPPSLERDLRAALQGIEYLADLERVRLRRAGSRYFVDVQLALEPASTLERASIVRDQVSARIKSLLPEADVIIEAEPRRAIPLGPFQQLQAVALRQNLSIHDLSIYNVDSGLDVEFHLELREALPLVEAHNLVSRLEMEMRAALPSIRQIVTHIEPEITDVSAASVLESERTVHRVAKIARSVPDLLDCHDILLRRSGGHLVLSCHCSFPDSLPVGRVHELVTDLEAKIKRDLPDLFRVTIHPEPDSDNRR